MFANQTLILGAKLLVAVATILSANGIQVEDCGSYGDIVFILDSSGSIDDDDYVIMQDFVTDVVAELGVDGNARFGLTVYDSSAWVEFYLNDYLTTEEVVSALSNITRRSSGGTDTAAGLAMARSMYTPSLGDREGHTNIAIIFTDGQSNDATATSAEAQANKDAGIRMIAIGVGAGHNVAELEEIASEPIQDNVFAVDDFDQLTAILSDVCEAVEDIELDDPESIRNGGHDCDEKNPCAPKLKTPGLFYYEHKDNAMFVQCSEWGQCYVMPCAPGTEWNQDVLTCVHAANGGDVDSENGYNCGNNNPCSPLKSPGLFYYPHTDDKKFVHCSECGQCYEMPCAPGTKWNQYILACDHETGGCDDDSGNGYNCGNRNPCSPLKTPGLFYYPHNDANKFVQCSEWGQCYEMQCAPGTEWNQDILSCDHEDDDSGGDGNSGNGHNCGNNNPCSPLKSPGLFYYPHTDSKKFVQCSEWGQCYEMPCATGTVWSQEHLVCVHA